MAGSACLEVDNFSIAISIATYVQGNDENARIQRRTIIRYLVLAEVLVLRDISSSVKKRFPTMDHVVNAGKLLTADMTNRQKTNALSI